MELFNCMISALECYKCYSCIFKTHFAVDFNEHIKTVHVRNQQKEIGETDPLETALTIPKTYDCINCQFETFSQLVLLKHVYNKCVTFKKRTKTHTIERLLRCKQCSFKSQYSRSLNRHVSTHTTLKPVTWFSCDKCSYRTRRRGDLNRHTIHKHIPEEALILYECQECPFKTKLKSGLKQHTITHLTFKDVEWFKCLQCAFKTKFKHELQAHLLKRHLSPDTEHEELNNMIWFKCEQCSFTTKKKDILKKHILNLHIAPSNVSWFECEQCTFKARRKADLKVHLSAIHGIADDDMALFHCEQCLYKTNYRGHLNRHVKSKHAVLQCGKCEFKATRKCDLKKHFC